ncbi:hypothetical protein BJ912DRAFT_980926, partial [Pholiota molesta]
RQLCYAFLLSRTCSAFNKFIYASRSLMSYAPTEVAVKWHGHLLSTIDCTIYPVEPPPYHWPGATGQVKLTTHGKYTNRWAGDWKWDDMYAASTV